MTYSKRLQEEIFARFCNNESPDAIAKSLNHKPNRNTIWIWVKEGNWNDRRKNVQQKSEKKLEESLSDVKTRQHNVLKHMVKAYVDQITSEEGRKRLQSRLREMDILNIFRHELLLMGEATDVIKTDVTIMSHRINTIMAKIIEEKRIVIGKESSPVGEDSMKRGVEQTK